MCLGGDKGFGVIYFINALIGEGIAVSLHVGIDVCLCSICIHHGCNFLSGELFNETDFICADVLSFTDPWVFG